MRRILYSVAIAALLVTSCQKTDVLNVAEDTIDFGTQVGKLTKADEVIDYSNDPKFGTLVKQGFRVWAVSDFTSGNHVDGTIYNSMNGLDVEYNSGWAFKNTAKYMWPQAGQHLYFYTMSSANTTWLDQIKEANYFVATQSVPTATEFTTPTYTVVSANDDIMVADHIHQDKGVAPNTTKVVKPNFRHTMTKVEFNFVKGGQSASGATAASTVILKSIVTSKLSNSGTLNVTYSRLDAAGDPDQTTAMTFEWTDDAASTNFTGTPDDVITIVKEDGAVVRPVASLDNETAEEGKAVVVYEKDNNGAIVKAKVYESVVTSGEGAETVTYGWTSTPEEHTYAESAWTTGEKYETFYGFELRTASEIVTATGNSNAKYDNFKTWYMIPQDLVDTQVVTITYLADGKTIAQDFKMTVNKGEGDTTEDWEEESCVRYNVTIAPHKIEFRPTVDDWEANPDQILNN